MNTYLFTWNPNKSSWDDLPEAVYQVNTGNYYYDYWSTGNTKRIHRGDRFLLMRLGVPPKGIIGLGQVLSDEPYQLPHWDEQKAKAGQKALRVDLLFSHLSELPYIAADILITDKKCKSFHWFPQASGVLIPGDIAAYVTTMVEKKTGSKHVQLTTQELGKLSEGKPKTITINTYDRSPRARQECLQHHGTSCFICGFNFEEKYGEMGKGFIHVHHLRPVADVGQEYKINPVRDLRPVCANCHAMLHKRRPPYGIKEIKVRT
jgi:5-methylcytosine-specific restriction enzyme A